MLKTWRRIIRVWSLDLSQKQLMETSVPDWSMHKVQVYASFSGCPSHGGWVDSYLNPQGQAWQSKALLLPLVPLFCLFFFFFEKNAYLDFAPSELRVSESRAWLSGQFLFCDKHNGNPGDPSPRPGVQDWVCVVSRKFLFLFILRIEKIRETHSRWTLIASRLPRWQAQAWGRGWWGLVCETIEEVQVRRRQSKAVEKKRRLQYTPLSLFPSPFLP